MEIEEVLFTCDICGKIYTSKKRHDTHQTKVHLAPASPSTSPSGLYTRIATPVVKLSPEDESAGWNRDYIQLAIDLSLREHITPAVFDGENSNKKKCIICTENVVDCAYIRCGHMITCYDCTTKLKNKNQKCPICRKEITKILKIYD